MGRWRRPENGSYRWEQGSGQSSALFSSEAGVQFRVPASGCSRRNGSLALGLFADLRLGLVLLSLVRRRRQCVLLMVSIFNRDIDTFSSALLSSLLNACTFITYVQFQSHTSLQGKEDISRATRRNNNRQTETSTLNVPLQKSPGS